MASPTVRTASGNCTVMVAWSGSICASVGVAANSEYRPTWISFACRFTLATVQMPAIQIAIAVTGCVGLRMDFFIMNLASKVLCNQTRIITKHRHAGNGKSIQPVAPFPEYALSSNVDRSNLLANVPQLPTDGPARLTIPHLLAGTQYFRHRAAGSRCLPASEFFISGLCIGMTQPM
jgi:hypothetical protein